MTGPQKFRKKPVEVEALLFTGENWTDVARFVGAPWRRSVGVAVIKTLEGKHVANPGDWIIKGVAGEFYPCKPDIFERTYEPGGDSAVSTALEQRAKIEALVYSAITTLENMHVICTRPLREDEASDIANRKQLALEHLSEAFELLAPGHRVHDPSGGIDRGE